jgi:hypothetical protein
MIAHPKMGLKPLVFHVMSRERSAIVYSRGGLASETKIRRARRIDVDEIDFRQC